MARRNTQRTPRQTTPAQLLERRVDTWIAAAGPLIDRLDRQLQIFERAFISLAQDVEYISSVLDREGMLEDEGPEPDTNEGEDYPDEAYQQDTDVRVDPDNPAHEVDLAEEAEESEESPEEEAARLIAEAEALTEAEAARLIAEVEAMNETTPEDY